MLLSLLIFTQTNFDGNHLRLQSKWTTAYKGAFSYSIGPYVFLELNNPSTLAKILNTAGGKNFKKSLVWTNGYWKSPRNTQDSLCLDVKVCNFSCHMQLHTNSQISDWGWITYHSVVATTQYVMSLYSGTYCSFWNSFTFRAQGSPLIWSGRTMDWYKVYLGLLMILLAELLNTP